MGAFEALEDENVFVVLRLFLVFSELGVVSAVLLVCPAEQPLTGDLSI